ADSPGRPSPGARPGTVQPRRAARPIQDPQGRLQRSASPSAHLQSRKAWYPAEMSAAVAPVLNTTTVEQSYRYCRKIAKARAKNFYYSFLLLEKPQRDAMCAIYAFMRYCDDLSDDPSTTDTLKLQMSIAQWRMDLDRALDGDVAGNPLWPAFYDTVQRY